MLAAEADGVHARARAAHASWRHAARPSAFDRYFVGPRLRRLSPELAARYLNRAGPYTALVRAIDAGTSSRGRTQVIGIRVPDLRISKFERRGDVLRDGAKRGYDAVMKVFAFERRADAAG